MKMLKTTYKTTELLQQQSERHFTSSDRHKYSKTDMKTDRQKSTKLHKIFKSEEETDSYLFSAVVRHS